MADYFLIALAAATAILVIELFVTPACWWRGWSETPGLEEGALRRTFFIRRPIQMAT